jgi:hypothetical protein
MRKLVWIIVLVVVAYFAWRWWRGRGGEEVALDRGESIIFNRVWVDHLPKQETESIQIFAMVKDESLGIFDNRSMWRGAWELFRYEPRGDGQLELLFPQSRAKQRVSYRAWKCNEKKDFDFCLELNAKKGVTKYYSQRGWEIGALDGARSVGQRLLGATH